MRGTNQNFSTCKWSINFNACIFKIRPILKYILGGLDFFTLSGEVWRININLYRVRNYRISLFSSSYFLLFSFQISALLNCSFFFFPSFFFLFFFLFLSFYCIQAHLLLWEASNKIVLHTCISTRATIQRSIMCFHNIYYWRIYSLIFFCNQTKITGAYNNDLHAIFFLSPE